MFSQTFKCLIAQAAVTVVLFAQLAVAAYACPTIDGPASVIAAANAEATHAAMPGCDMGKNDSNPNLCLQHCQAGDQSVQTLPHLAVPPLAAVPALSILEPVLTQSGTAVALKTAWSIQVPLPPPLLRFGVLRI
jgi:hypothetical protein